MQKVWILSGEGEIGTLEIYRGKRTPRALKSRLTRERCGGARWAIAQTLAENGIDRVELDPDDIEPITEKYRYECGVLFEYQDRHNAYVAVFAHAKCRTKKEAIEKYESADY